LWTDEVGVSSGKLAGIWQSGGGIMSDGPNRIFLATGNGISPPESPGNTPPDQLAESVIRLAPSSTDGSLTAKDFFSGADAPALDAADHDFGAGGPVGLPFGTKTYPHLMTQEGKGGTLYILNRDDLGGREQTSSDGDQDLASLSPLPEHFGHPAAFGNTTTLTSGNASNSSDYMVFVGKQDYMRELKFGVSSSDKPTITDYANSTFTLGFSSGSGRSTRPVAPGPVPRWARGICCASPRPVAGPSCGRSGPGTSAPPASSPSPPAATAWCTWAPGTASCSPSASRALPPCSAAAP
jgi:hypothetical protein